jgi:hypothetical protein
VAGEPNPSFAQHQNFAATAEFLDLDSDAEIVSSYWSISEKPGGRRQGDMNLLKSWVVMGRCRHRVNPLHVKQKHEGGAGLHFGLEDLDAC